MSARRWQVFVALPLTMLLAACTGSSTTASTPPSDSSHPRVSRTVTAGVPVGPWDARTVGGVGGRDQPLAGDLDSLYVSHGAAILRLDPASGDVLSRRTVGRDVVAQAEIVANRLWTVQAAAAGRVIVRGLSLDTLTPVASITVHMTARAVPIDDLALDAAPHEGRLYLGVENTVAVLDANTHHVVHRFRLSGEPIADLAVSPDGARLYVTSNIAKSMRSQLAVLNPNTGAATVRPITLDGGTGFGGIAASAGGVWLPTGSGMSDWLAFRRSSELAHPSRPLTHAGGGFVTTSTVTDRVVWVGGTTTLACADPQTGAARATARVPAPHDDAANISRITVAGGRLFAYYLADAGPSRLLIVLHPPARCRT
jgi:DNA-binding beta-propeller fold protein YncE